METTQSETSEHERLETDEARQAERHGVINMLVISTAAAALALIAAAIIFIV